MHQFTRFDIFIHNIMVSRTNTKMILVFFWIHNFAIFAPQYNCSQCEGAFSGRNLGASYFQSEICFKLDNVWKAYDSLVLSLKEIGFVIVQSSISHPDTESNVNLSNFVQFLDGLPLVILRVKK